MLCKFDPAGSVVSSFYVNFVKKDNKKQQLPSVFYHEASLAVPQVMHNFVTLSALLQGPA